jgi:phage minor structural protein
LLTITDIGGNTEALTGYRGLQRKRNVNGEKTLAFLVMPTPQNAHSYPMVSEESIVEFDGEPYRIKQLAEKSRGTTFYKEVVAVHTFFDLIDEHVYALHNGSMTFEAALQFVLGGTEYTWSIVDTFYAQDFENFGDDNRLALFQTLLVRYGAEFTLNGTNITFRERIGNATDFQFRYNYNVKTITRYVKTGNLSTYIKGYGKDIESEYTSPNASVFGIRHAKPVRDEHYTTLEGLNARLQAELNDEPEVSITIDFADLRRAGFPFDVPSEGDDVFLIYEPIGIDVETRLVDIDEEFTEGSDLPIKTFVTLGNIRDSIVDRWANVEKQVNGIIGGDGKVKYNVLDAAVKRATEALQSAQTELEFENGILARSKDNPNHLVLLNSAGVGISTDGGATFSEAITHLGVNTSVLTAGQINANNIAVRGGGETDYSLIDVNGFFAKGTAFTVQRPDGYTLINDGILKNGFNLFSAYPPFRTSGATQVGPWMMVATTNRFETINSYTFRHDSRYILVAFGLYTDNGITGYMSYDLSDVNGGGDLVNLGTSTNSGPDTEGVYTYLLDMGVPTGQLKRLNIRLYGSDANWGVYGRILYLSQEG